MGGRVNRDMKRKEVLEEIVEYIREHGRIPPRKEHLPLRDSARRYFGRVSIAMDLASEEYARRFIDGQRV